MPYNKKQYDAAFNFFAAGDDNVPNASDQKRIQAYELYENLYINAAFSLSIILRGDDQNPLLMPSAKKIIEATNRFLGINLGYYVEPVGDVGTAAVLDQWWSEFVSREILQTKFGSSKRWGLVRGDGALYVYARPEKASGSRLSVIELDPRQIFEIEDPTDPLDVIGYHVVELIQDAREADKPDKQVAKRRTFRRTFDETTGQPLSVTSELRFFEKGKWDDRDPVNREKIEEITEAPFAELVEEALPLEGNISQLPIYKWKNNPFQNTTWGTSQLAGLETLIYGINQTLSDEDATLVFQGLGMYVTTAAPPVDATTNQVGDWNIGPKQIIEIGQDQRFDRVTGVSDISAYTNHMTWIDEKGLSEASGTPEIAIGRVDVSVAESGISLQLQLAPLIAQNAEKELELINVMDQMFHDITTMWLPAYEPELFPNPEVMSQMSVVCVFDDPMPKNRDAEVQETLLLVTSNLILTTMAIAKLRELGWKYPTADPLTGAPLTDEDIAALLSSQTTTNAAALDPYSQSLIGGDPGAEDPNADPNTDTSVDLGTSE